MNSKSEFYVKTHETIRRCSRAELKLAVSNGEFRPEDLISKSNQGPWVQLSSVKGLEFKTDDAMPLNRAGNSTHTPSSTPTTSSSDVESSIRNGPLKAQCSCGKSTFVSKTLAGKRLKCPTCQDWFVVTSEPVIEVPSTTKPFNGSKFESHESSIRSADKLGSNDELTCLGSQPIDAVNSMLTPPPLPDTSSQSTVIEPRIVSAKPLIEKKRSSVGKVIAAFVSAILLLALIAAIVDNSSKTRTNIVRGLEEAVDTGVQQPTSSLVNNAVASVATLRRKLSLNQSERIALKEEISRIEHQLGLAEIEAKTVYQQQAARLEACIELTGTVATALGASSESIKEVLLQMNTRESRTETVFQQVAVRLTGHIDMLKLACEKAGASPTAIRSIESELERKDALAETAQQQIASRTTGVLRISELLASSLGADPQRIASIDSSVERNDSISETVFQQMSARQTGTVRMLGAAAKSSGAAPSDVAAIEDQMSIYDNRVKTVQQQFAERIQKTFEMTRILVQSIVLK